MAQETQYVRFPFKQDVLYIRGTSPIEYLYIHSEDDKGALFMAYFESLLSDTPLIYPLSNSDVPSLVPDEDGNIPEINDLLKQKKGSGWKKANMINAVFPGKWNQILCMEREKLLCKNNNKE